jgi:cytochrome c peroxidase
MNTIRTIIAVAALSVIAVAVRASGVTNIDQAGQQFSEKSVKLAVGDTIQFNNKDDVTHNINVVNEDDDDTDLGLQKPGQVLTYKFDKAGRFKIRCGIHPNMKMAVSVQ